MGTYLYFEHRVIHVRDAPATAYLVVRGSVRRRCISDGNNSRTDTTTRASGKHARLQKLRSLGGDCADRNSGRESHNHDHMQESEPENDDILVSSNIGRHQDRRMRKAGRL